MKQCFLVVALLVSSLFTFGQKNWAHGKITAAKDGHHLQYEDGTPFFWLGDTAWELFHRLNREEIKFYLDNRKAKGFTVIQAVVLAEFDGLKKPNQEGEVPLIDLDPLKPNEKYFSIVDYTISLAQERGLVIGLLPTWGDKVTKMWGEGPEIFNAANAMSYGRWLGARYKKYSNIIWILGGDRPPQTDSLDYRPIWRALAKGIESTYGKKATISYHISGGQNTTSTFLHNEAWLDINMMQSSHGSGHDVPVWNWIERDYKLVPLKPTLDSEPNYEDHPVNPWPKYDPLNGYFNDYDVRKQCYRSVFAGACGVTYGHHSLWQFWSVREEKINNAIFYWRDAIDRPGAFQVGYLRWLMESRLFMQTVPAQELLSDSSGVKGDHIRAMKANDGSFAMVYLPVGKTIALKTGLLSGTTLKYWWFNPRNGQSRLGGNLAKKDITTFTSPTLGFEEDWVFVIDDVSKEYPVPGTH
jgi:hypothetical protein